MSPQENDSNQPPHLLDIDTKRKINGAAKAAGLVAILSVSGTVIGFIAVLTKSSVKIGPAKEGFNDTAVQTAASGTAVLASALTVISLLFVYLLYSFSRFTRRGLWSGDGHAINKGLSYLSIYFKIIGIGLIGLLAISFLRMLATGLGAAA